MLCAPPSKSLEIVSRTDCPPSVFTRHLHIPANLRTNDPACARRSLNLTTHFVVLIAKASSMGNVGLVSTLDKEEGPRMAKKCALP
jgi:hypothetical protein